MHLWPSSVGMSSAKLRPERPPTPGSRSHVRKRGGAPGHAVVLWSKPLAHSVDPNLDTPYIPDTRQRPTLLTHRNQEEGGKGRN